ncbi:MAG: hypothetical protein JW947_04690 [Sedimentisphaerales bacterium]|nr:hypothetical protein [Sedimentisphaerales bacterium]
MSANIAAFSFGKGAREEVARAKKEGIDITLITIQDILDKKFSVLPSAESKVTVKKGKRGKLRTTVGRPDGVLRGDGLALAGARTC